MGENIHSSQCLIRLGIARITYTYNSIFSYNTHVYLTFPYYSEIKLDKGKIYIPCSIYQGMVGEWTKKYRRKKVNLFDYFMKPLKLITL